MAELGAKLETIVLKKPMLLQGRVMHARSVPKANKFEYDNLYFYLPLGFKEQLKNKFFSFNRFNLFSFFDSDHSLLNCHPEPSSCHPERSEGSRETNSESLLKEFQEILRCAQDDKRISHNDNKNKIPPVKNVILISHPRILGYAFNPASFWLGFDEEENLIVSLVEVRNTFGQKHSYLLFNENLSPIFSNQWLESDKEFHVSPFFEKKGNYKFRFVVKENQLDFYINYYVDNQLQLATSLKCHYQELSDKNLIISLIKMPFLMFKTIFLIHFQAFKLWVFKGTKYHSLPPKLGSNLTINKNVKK